MSITNYSVSISYLIGNV